MITNNNMPSNRKQSKINIVSRIYISHNRGVTYSEVVEVKDCSCVRVVSVARDAHTQSIYAAWVPVINDFGQAIKTSITAAAETIIVVDALFGAFFVSKLDAGSML